MTFMDRGNEGQYSSIGVQREKYRLGDTTAVNTVEAFFREADNNPQLNIYITQARDEAIEAARQSDERLASGTTRKLEGLPIAVKDNFCTKGIRTTAASRMLENFVPTYESTVTQKLLNAGAIILGKTNMDEFAMGSSTETSYFGPTLNPVGKKIGIPDLVPGGSSGGSAAAVSANFALAAIGTDTGGSIRQPASFCGVVGFKPTYGYCSRWGIVSYASSLDQAGVLCNSVEDAAILMDVIAGEDKKDTTSIAQSDFGFEKRLHEAPRKLKIGILREAVQAGSTEDTKIVWDACRKVGDAMNVDFVDVSMPTFPAALPAYYIIALSEASSNLARYDGVRYGYRSPSANDITEMYENTRGEGFGSEVKRRILMGTYSLSAGYYDAYYLRAMKVRRKILAEFAEVFSKVDFLFMPTTPTAAFKIGSHSGDPVSMYLEDVYTVPINMAGLPAVSIPITSNDIGLPLGLQIVGRQFSDVELVRAAASVETVSSVLFS